jgi:signal transduction histidine kinase
LTLQHASSGQSSVLVAHAQDLTERRQAEDHTYQTDALRAIARASQLNLQLLGYSGQLKLKPMNVDANSLLLTLPNELRGKLDSSIDLKVLPCVNLPAIYIDRNQLKGCILNLSMNALLAMPDGGSLTLQSSIETSPLTDAPSDATIYVKLSVIDTGIGMS